MRYIKNPENLRYSLNIIIPLIVFLSSILSAVIAIRTHDMDQGHFFLWVIAASLFTAICSLFVVLAMTEPIKELIRKVERTITIDDRGKIRGQMIEVYNVIERLMELARLDRERDKEGDIDLKKEITRLDYIVPLGYMSLMVAHEVRNPLNTITGMSELLKSRLTGEKENLYIDTILNSAKKIDEFTKEILDFTDDAVDEAEFDLVSVIRDALNTLSLQFSDVSWVFDEKKPIMYRGDKNKIYQALFNIIKNAFEYEKEKGSVRIVIRADGDITVSVYNEHSSVEKDDRENIFKPFFTKKRGGRGIGLFIAMKNIRLHNGNIDVESSDRGTTFTVRLPKVIK
ncbi:MAG TPA: HAMP domain-containing sensor histidine kinase [Syntrophorhabdaceae bacterium]|nr:HAMP domain-containing sensor histidine kinase [Syntrophorhabdaceae bacterium]